MPEDMAGRSVAAQPNAIDEIYMRWHIFNHGPQFAELR